MKNLVKNVNFEHTKEKYVSMATTLLFQIAGFRQV